MNELTPNETAVLGRITIPKVVHNLNAYSSINVTEEGRVIFFNEVHNWNEHLSINFKEVRSISRVKDVQLLNEK